MRVKTMRHHTRTGTSTGTAAEDDDDGVRPVVVHLRPNVIARLMGIDAAAVAVPPPPPKATTTTSPSTIIQIQAAARPAEAKPVAAAIVTSPRFRQSRCSSLLSYYPYRGRSGGWLPRPRPRPRHAAAGPAAATPPHDSVVVVTARARARSGPRAAAGGASAAAAEEESGYLQARKDGHGDGASAAPESPSQSHTPIVLLKPTTCSESHTAAAGVAIAGGGRKGTDKTLLLPGLPRLHRDASMSTLLQEVKGRVQKELAVLTASTTAGYLVKTPASAWPISPSRQVDLQTVTEDDADRGNGNNKRRLFRSESFRAFRRDRKRNAGAPPPPTPPAAAAATATKQHASPEEKADEEESLTDIAPLSSVLQPGVVGVTDGQSFRSECLTTKRRDDDATASPPRLLFRSFSAPESGFSFSLGRLLSFKQHEASEPATAAAAVRMISKSAVSAASFSSFIRGTVSSLRRHGFRSTGNLLMSRRKTHWPSSSNNNKTSHPAKMEMEMPISAATTPPCHEETFNLFKVAQAHLSELPPSPVSPLEVAAGHSSRHFFSDLHFTLPPELSPKCLSEFETPGTASESSYRTDITAVEATWSRDKAYITELLIAAGLYDDDGDAPSSGNARVDSMARPMPMCDDVFEDVEDMYYYRGDYIVGGGGMYDDETDGGTTAATDHRMLFDLANEALQSLAAVAESSRAGSSSLRRWVVDSTTGVARGKKLVDDVWQQVQALMRNHHPQAQELQTIEIDGMVAYEVRRCVWAEVLLHEHVYVVGRKIERAIFDELIEEFFACAGGFQ